MKLSKRNKSEIVTYKSKKPKARNPFEPGDWVRITDTRGFNKTTIKAFQENPFIQVIESNRWGVRLYGFDGFYHHDRFTPNLELGAGTKNSMLIEKVGTEIKKLLN